MPCFLARQKQVEEELKDFPVKVGKETSLWVVGEAYAKWDSVVSFYPCITFIFVEDTQSNNPRKSQIKLRINKPSSEWTTADVKALQAKVLENTNLEYKYGKTRGNYVSADKRLKTTIFADNKAEVEQVLTNTFSIIDETFSKDLLTLTFGNGKRPSSTRRMTGLNGIGTNPNDYNTSFSVKLNRVVLMVHGLARPVELYP